MRLEIEKIGTTNTRDHYRIVYSLSGSETAPGEDQLRDHPKVSNVIGSDYHSFEKGLNPEFPNTWFLHVIRLEGPTIID